MSGAFRYHHGAQLALLTSVGPLERHEWAELVGAMVASTPPGGVHRVLSDRRRMVGPYPPWMAEVIAEGFRVHGAALGTVRWAVLLPPELADQAGFVRQMQQKAGVGVTIRPFLELATAVGWLLGYSDPEELAPLVDWVDAMGSQV